MKKIQKFDSLCAEIKKVIEQRKLPFFCYPVDENFMWIGTNDRTIGGMLCHYEILMTDKTYENYDPENPITVDVQFETSIINFNTINEITKELKGLDPVPAPNDCPEYYKWFRHTDKKFPLDISVNNINNIVQELVDINKQYGKKIRKIFHI